MTDIQDFFNYFKGTHSDLNDLLLLHIKKYDQQIKNYALE